MKIKEKTHEKCIWAMDMMSNLALYINRPNNLDNFFKAGDVVIGDGTPICIGSDSKLTGLIVVNDTSVKTS